MDAYLYTVILTFIELYERDPYDFKNKKNSPYFHLPLNAKVILLGSGVVA